MTSPASTARTTRTPRAAGAPCWADLTSTDHAASLAFYTALFGWDAETPDAAMGNYANFLREGERLVGSMPGTVDAWTVYFATTDAERTAQLVQAEGGAVHAPVMDVMDLGRLAVLGDPGGSAFGIWQAGTHTGFPVLDVPGAPSWFELHTRDYDAVLAFYRSVLGCQVQVVSDVPGFRYATAVIDGREVAGVMDAAGFLPEGAPAAWKVYFFTDDADATVARAVELGATVVDPAEDTPYGRLATLADPQGAVFKLRQPPADA
ncbi:MAG TPA: VOC family protein [Mycobacteriales bacterium]|jgi:hypothetical protein|nr:VOC family protein [Mycobacteriales bacterium]